MDVTDRCGETKWTGMYRDVRCGFLLHLKRSQQRFCSITLQVTEGGRPNGARYLNLLERFSFSTATDATTDATKWTPLKVIQDPRGRRDSCCSLSALLSLHNRTIV